MIAAAAGASGEGSGLSSNGCAGGSEIGRGADSAAEPYGECGGGNGGGGGRGRGTGGTGKDAGGSGNGGRGGAGGGGGGGAAAPGAAVSGSGCSSSSAVNRHTGTCGPQRRQGPAQLVGQQEEPGRGWAVAAYEAATGRLCTDALQRSPLRNLEWVHLVAIHAGLGVWRLLHTHRLRGLLPGHPGPRALPSVYDTARLSAAAARAMQRILHGEGSGIIGGRRWAGTAAAKAPPTAALPYARIATLPRAFNLMRDLAWGDLALRWQGLGAAEAQRCMLYWLEAVAVVLGIVAEAVEAGAGADATMDEQFQSLADDGMVPAYNALRLMDALGCMLHGVPGGESQGTARQVRAQGALDTV